jgi:COMPASS component SWD3
MNVMVTA